MGLVTIDFETAGIESRPKYPPRPVGVSIKRQGYRPKYYAFGHPAGNNCTIVEAKTRLKQIWDSDDELLFHNSKFDLDIAQTFFKLALPPVSRIHDTLFLVFLNDPRQKSMGLKPSAEAILGQPPEERDAVCDWLITNQPIPGVKISTSKKSPHTWGRYISHAPVDLVEPYANGDVQRTEALFLKLHPSIIARGMQAAYERELKLMLVLLEMERYGLPVGMKKLTADVDFYQNRLVEIDKWLDQQLSCTGVNYSSGEQLMEVLIRAGKVDTATIPRTPKTGKYQTNKEALASSIQDPVLLSILKYRSQLGTCVNTFMNPWLETAKLSGGYIYASWNQVRQDYHSGDNVVGASTGRITSTPNFQNIPKEFEVNEDAFQLVFGKHMEEYPWMPLVRSYVVPFPDEYLIDRDYSQQELRIFAHFDDGHVKEQYIQNPWLDMHNYARDELAKMGLFYDRKPVKNTNFGLIYGMGVGKLAAKNGMTYADASVLKFAVLKLYPGLNEMYIDMKIRSRANQPVHTWGGREYYCEPPALVNGRLQEYDYKLVNVIIQGSAADCTKEAMIRFAKAKDPSWRLLLTVHDELAASARQLKPAMRCLKECMNSIEFDVPMLSEGSYSKKSWADLIDYDKGGVDLV